MWKKTMLLASMALALLGLAAPAAQAEETFWTNEGEFEFTGELTWDRGGLQTGPAAVHLQANLFNGPETGEGEITEGSATGTVPTNLPGCVASITLGRFPWTVKLTSLIPRRVFIGKLFKLIRIIWHYSSGCAAFGVPSTVPTEGVITGAIENEGGNEVCINLNEDADDMHVEGTGEAPPTIDVTGVICAEGTEA